MSQAQPSGVAAAHHEDRHIYGVIGGWLGWPEDVGFPVMGVLKFHFKILLNFYICQKR
jgi:hypothetical protein